MSDMLRAVKDHLLLYAHSSMSESELVERLFDLFKGDPEFPEPFPTIDPDMLPKEN